VFEHRIISITFFEPRLGYGQETGILFLTGTGIFSCRQHSYHL